MTDQTELKKELHGLADDMNVLISKAKRIYDEHHQPGTASQDLSALDYLHCDVHSALEDEIVPLITLQDRYDDQGDDGDFRFRMNRDDAREQHAA